MRKGVKSIRELSSWSIIAVCSYPLRRKPRRRHAETIRKQPPTFHSYRRHVLYPRNLTFTLYVQVYPVHFMTPRKWNIRMENQCIRGSLCLCPRSKSFPEVKTFKCFHFSLSFLEFQRIENYFTLYTDRSNSKHCIEQYIYIYNKKSK